MIGQQSDINQKQELLLASALDGDHPRLLSAIDELIASASSRKAAGFYLCAVASKAERKNRKKTASEIYSRAVQINYGPALIPLANVLVDLEKLDAASEIFAKIDPRNSLPIKEAARLIVAYGKANRLPDARIVFEAHHRVAAEKGNPNIHLRFANVLVQQEELDEARAIANQAERIAPDDSKVSLFIKALAYENFDYWEARYRALGRVASVPFSDQCQSDFQARLEREREFIASMFKTLGLDPADSILEAGCGSGRLTEFLIKRTERLVSVDISPTALEFCLKRMESVTHDSNFRAKIFDLTHGPLSEQFQLVFDYTVVQHVADSTDWVSVLTNYAAMVEPHGWLVIFGTALGENGKPHLSDATFSDYIGVLKELGLKSVDVTRLDDEITRMVFKKV